MRVKARILLCLAMEGAALAILDRLLEINGELAIYADASQALIFYKLEQYQNALFSFERVLSYPDSEENRALKLEAEEFKKNILQKEAGYAAGIDHNNVYSMGSRNNA